MLPKNQTEWVVFQSQNPHPHQWGSDVWEMFEKNPWLFLSQAQSVEWVDALLLRSPINDLLSTKNGEDPSPLSYIFRQDNSFVLGEIIKKVDIRYHWSGYAKSTNIVDECIKENAVECLNVLLKHQKILKVFHKDSLIRGISIAMALGEKSLDCLERLLIARFNELKNIDIPQERIIEKIPMAMQYNDLDFSGGLSVLDKFFSPPSLYKSDLVYEGLLKNELIFRKSGLKNEIGCRKIINNPDFDLVEFAKYSTKNYPSVEMRFLMSLVSPQKASNYLKNKKWPKALETYRSLPNFLKSEMEMTLLKSSKSTPKRKI